MPKAGPELQWARENGDRGRVGVHHHAFVMHTKISSPRSVFEKVSSGDAERGPGHWKPRLPARPSSPLLPTSSDAVRDRQERPGAFIWTRNPTAAPNQGDTTSGSGRLRPFMALDGNVVQRAHRTTDHEGVGHGGRIQPGQTETTSHYQDTYRNT